MSRRVRCVISVLLLAAMLTACGKASPAAESAAAPIETVPDPEPTPAPVEVKLDYVIDEPVIEEDSGASKRVTFYRDGNPIKAKLMLPEGERPFPTVVITGGLYASLGLYSEKARVFNENGYAVVELRPTNNKMPAFYSEPEYLGDFVYEQTLDILAVTDALEFFPELDLSKLFLFGHSMGGLATAYAGVLKQDAIRAMILVEPSFQYPESMTFENGQTLPTAFYPLLSECETPVLIVKGTGERPDLPDFPHFYDRAIEALPKAELVTVEGADHPMNGDYGTQMVEQVVRILNGLQQDNTTERE